MKKQIRLTFAAAVLAAGLMGGFLASQMTGEKKQDRGKGEGLPGLLCLAGGRVLCKRDRKSVQCLAG